MDDLRWLNERWLLTHKETAHSHKTEYFMCQLMLNLPFIERKRSKIAHAYTWKIVPLYNTLKIIIKREKQIFLSQCMRGATRPFYIDRVQDAVSEGILQAVSKFRSHHTDVDF